MDGASRRQVTGALWIAGYASMALTPLALIVFGRPPSSNFRESLAFSLGLIGFALLGLQFLTVARSRRVAAPFGIDVVMRFHQQMSFVAAAFLVSHPILLLTTRPSQVLDPRAGVVLGQVALGLLLLTILGAVFRLRLRLGYELWRLGHGIGAVSVLTLAAAHIVAVGTWVDAPWEKVVFVALAVGAIGAYAEVRLVRPLRQLRRRWEVDEVTEVAAETWDVVLRPIDHDGLRFGAGQFAWVRFADSPFGLREHPFSFSSAQDDDRIRFTIKSLGDDTAEIGSLDPGTRAFVDGPFGAFQLDRYPADRLLLVAGGVGIAPILSILRTMAASGDRRPVELLVANDHEHDIIHRQQLDELAEALDLRIVHVLAEPSDDWDGERGYVDAELLRRQAVDGPGRLQCFVCGPPPMMDATIEALRTLGVPANAIHQEVFDFV